MKQATQLEICAADIQSVYAAAQGGAHRVELCSGLAEGGVTPSTGFVIQALKIPGIKVHVLIRPRPGDFLYTPEETEIMINDIRAMRKLGAHGVVIGALTPDGDIDTKLCQLLVSEATGLNITFHRAFDLTRDPRKALEQIIQLGCSRILTSGCAASAHEGVNMLRELSNLAGNRITLLAGGGVTPANAAEIMAKGRIQELHASARTSVHSLMSFHHHGISMGSPGNNEYSRLTTDAAVVKQIAKAMNTINLLP